MERTINKHLIEYNDEEAMELASSIVEKYVYQKLTGAQFPNIKVMDEALQDFLSTETFWKNGKI